MTQFGCFVSVLLPASARAESVYRWKSPDGNWIYGTKPPPGTRASEAVVGRSFSKYNSDRMIKAFHPRGSVENPGGSRAQLGTLKESDLLGLPGKLEAAPAVIETNDSGEVTACRAKVKNTGGRRATNVLVSFQFSDGSLVQGIAAGQPKSPSKDGLEPNEEVEFEIAPENLPLRINEKTPSPPEVLLQYKPEGAGLVIPPPATEQDVAQEQTTDHPTAQDPE